MEFSVVIFLIYKDKPPIANPSLMQKEKEKEKQKNNKSYDGQQW